jgi:hypothetical protein
MMNDRVFPLPPLPEHDVFAAKGGYSSKAMHLYALDARRPILEEAIKDFKDLRARFEKIVAVVNEQAEDFGLWFDAVYATEAYLQQELRRLHAVIEAQTK